jgi:AcrR family transcriptional regulator
MIVSEPTAREERPTENESPPLSTGRRRAGGPEATRQRLLDAGRRLFGAFGPHAVTSHAIAAEAGYAAGTFYLHFKDKLSLFQELAEEAAADLERRLRAAFDRRDWNTAELVETQAEVLVGFAEEQRELIRIMFHPGSETGAIGAGILERLARGVSARRREAAAGGTIDDRFDPDVVAQAVVGMWAHVLAWWATDPSRASREAIVRTLTEIQLHGSRGPGLRPHDADPDSKDAPSTASRAVQGEPSR